jgi:hemerythrin-like domain-containing protein
MMTPAGALMIEHRLIERVVHLLVAQLQRVRDHQTCDPPLLAAAVQFMDEYADQCHHAKEEDFFFKALASKALEDPLREMLHGLLDDHVRSRQLAQRLGQTAERLAAGEQSALAEIEACLVELTELYLRHIAIEEKEFFPPAQERFSDEERARMLAQFQQFDQQLLHRHYREVVDEWAATEPPAPPANNP